MTDPLVSTDWLAGQLGEADLMVVDASWFLPGSGRAPHAEYAQAHIPGAVFFDVDAVSDPSSDLPHMLPSPDAFAQAVGDLGIGDHTRVVAYDSNGFIASARVWWSFRVMGHTQVFVLDGGMTKWRSEDRPLTSDKSSPSRKSFTARFNPGLVRDFAQVKADPSRVVDVRPAPRFAGEAPEPRPGLRSGHMPGAKNLPYAKLLTADDRLQPPDALAATLRDAGVDLGAPLVASCGSGVSACILALAAARLGDDHMAVYDGSWAEWGARSDAPVVAGS